MQGVRKGKVPYIMPFFAVKGFFPPPLLPRLLNKEVRWLPKSEQMLFMDIYTLRLRFQGFPIHFSCTSHNTNHPEV